HRHLVQDLEALLGALVVGHGAPAVVALVAGVLLHVLGVVRGHPIDGGLAAPAVLNPLVGVAPGVLQARGGIGVVGVGHPGAEGLAATGRDDLLGDLVVLRPRGAVVQDRLVRLFVVAA